MSNILDFPKKEKSIVQRVLTLCKKYLILAVERNAYKSNDEIITLIEIIDRLIKNGEVK